MLVDVIKSGVFESPLQDMGWYSDSGGPIDHAGKITKNQREVRFERDSVRDILKVQRVIGAPYCLLPNGARLILDELTDAGHPVSTRGTVAFSVDDTTGSLLVRLSNGETLCINKSTYEGGKTGQGNSRVIRLIRENQLQY